MKWEFRFRVKMKWFYCTAVVLRKNYINGLANLFPIIMNSSERGRYSRRKWWFDQKKFVFREMVLKKTINPPLPPKYVNGYKCSFLNYYFNIFLEEIYSVLVHLWQVCNRHALNHRKEWKITNYPRWMYKWDSVKITVLPLWLL